MTDKDKAQQPLVTKKKVLKIKAAPLMALLQFEWIGGGELPPELSGTYTSARAAKDAALAYYAGKGETVEFETPLDTKGKSETRRSINAGRDIQPI